jgi:hypothetical protein
LVGVSLVDEAWAELEFRRKARLMVDDEVVLELQQEFTDPVGTKCGVPPPPQKKKYY